MLFINWNINPEIFRIGGFALRYYSLGFLLAFFFSYRIMKSFFVREGVPLILLEKLTVSIFLATLIGARLGHCLFYDWAYFKHHLLEIISPVSLQNGHLEFTGFQGLASHGGAVGILLAALWWCRKYAKPPFWLLDRLSLVIPIAAFFIRIGNLFNSEIIGKPSDLPFAFIFERVDFIPRHPAQLYEALSYLLLAGMLYRLYSGSIRPGNSPALENITIRESGNPRRADGFLFGLLLAGLFTIRFFIEFAKEDQEAFESHWLLNMGQILSIPFIGAGILLAIAKSKKKETPGLPLQPE
ncbi:MAG: prolipoprotein diacylglyceryl transferase [Puia sp.]|nr:prolipoprotein diacylglyceryl transferase [Puia sp.]